MTEEFTVFVFIYKKKKNVSKVDDDKSKTVLLP